MPGYSQREPLHWDFEAPKQQEEKNITSCWNTTIAEDCHKGEKFRLINELLFPLNKSNTKYVKIGYSPHDNFTLALILWDVKTNNQIFLTLHDIFRIQLFLMATVTNFNADLSTANIYRDTKYQTLFHIQEKNGVKKLSFTECTLKTLVQSKHIYQYPIQMPEFLVKANSIIDILKNNFNFNNLNFTEKELREHFNEIHNQMVEKDRIFLSQMIYKFPSTLLTILKKM
jgi:hypothetical protein